MFNDAITEYLSLVKDSGGIERFQTCLQIKNKDNIQTWTSTANSRFEEAWNSAIHKAEDSDRPGKKQKVVDDDELVDKKEYRTCTMTLRQALRDDVLCRYEDIVSLANTRQEDIDELPVLTLEGTMAVGRKSQMHEKLLIIPRIVAGALYDRQETLDIRTSSFAT
ncbi:hypothetical protein BGZ65_006343 [Modicella reniformis]|uniref:Uncharacterized protein n=1 Tax=Modicella reniformis TaxID=1440133 RepID=A0A9P6IJF8_9FUNG|nr:hypothetical protein BGZ65_006343 [Modicella reniformis]